MASINLKNKEPSQNIPNSSDKFNLGQFLVSEEQKRIISLPLQFQHIPVQILSKQFTKLNNQHQYRIHYLGPRVKNTIALHKKFAFTQKHPHIYESEMIENKKTKKSLNKLQNSIAKAFDDSKKSQNKMKTFRSKENKNEENVLENEIERYKVNMKKICHSYLLDEKLKNTQFFKSTAFYRAFQGMNPSLNNIEDQYIFNSEFEGGNLDCVIKVQPTQFDLFLKIDSNTRGHLMWFYFSVKNGKRLQKIRLNICNISKSKSLYKNGLKPYLYSKKKKLQDPSQGQFECKWSQAGDNLGLQKKQFRYQILKNKVSTSNMNCLTLQYQFTQIQDQVFFAYCVPYTYSQLLNDIQNLPNKYVNKYSLGKSLLGVDIPILHISNHQSKIILATSNFQKDKTINKTIEKNKTIDLPYQSTTTQLQSQTENIHESIKSPKKVVFVTGRIHPSQSNSSYSLMGFIHWICSQSKDAIQIREKTDFVIVPMVNPDGVILGNSRTSASGKDLNREYVNPDCSLYPQIYKIKELATKINSSFEITLYLDFHGHSRKKNTFFYGPAYGISEPNYYKSRILPKLIEKVNNSFRYHSCSFSIIQDKKKTARAAMFQQLKIPFTYTVESSIGYFYDCNKLKIFQFNSKSWMDIGSSIAEGTTSFILGLQFYEELIKQRRKNRLKNKKSDRFSPTKNDIVYFQDEMYMNLNLQLDQPLKIQYNQKQQKQFKKPKNAKRQFLKLLEQLKITSAQSKVGVSQEVKDLDAEMSSDSHDQKQDMDINKLKQLNVLIKTQNNTLIKKEKEHSSTNVFQNYKKAHKNMKFELDDQIQILKELQQKQLRQSKPKTRQQKRYNEQKLFQINLLSENSISNQQKRQEIHSSNVIISNNCFQTPFKNSFKRDIYTSSRRSRRAVNNQTQKRQKTQGSNYFGEYHLFIQASTHEQTNKKKFLKNQLIRRLQSKKEKIKSRAESSNQIKMYRTSTVNFNSSQIHEQIKQKIKGPTEFSFSIPCIQSEPAQQKHNILRPKLRLNLKGKPKSSKSAKSSITYHSQIKNIQKNIVPQSLYLIRKPANSKQKFIHFSTMMSTRSKKIQSEKNGIRSNRFTKIDLNDMKNLT